MAIEDLPYWMKGGFLFLFLPMALNFTYYVMFFLGFGEMGLANGLVSLGIILQQSDTTDVLIRFGIVFFVGAVAGYMFGRMKAIQTSKEIQKLE
jgi:hypothetical protein